MLNRIKVLPRKPLLATVAVLVLLLAVYFGFSRSSNHQVIRSTNPLSNNTSNNSAGQISRSNSSPSNDSSDNQTPSGSNQNSQPVTGTPPTTPYGNFVSNHHPGGSAPTSESSTCNTSPGAVCYIEFNKGSETKKLTTQTTNGAGAAIWYWDVKNAGLSSGQWTITAIASLNGQTSKANDALPLVVQ